MTDLAAQILAALDRAEETARAATPGRWEVSRDWAAGRDLWPVTSLQNGVTWDVADGVAVQENAAHIAANDPAHVLRLTTALREVVAMCADQLAMNTPPSAVNSEVVWLAEDTLRALASVWDVPGDSA